MEQKGPGRPFLCQSQCCGAAAGLHRASAKRAPTLPHVPASRIGTAPLMQSAASEGTVAPPTAWVLAAMIYEVRFKRNGGNVYSTETIQADDDQSAIAMARRMLKSGIGNGYEIWQGDRLVHTESAARR